MAKASAPPMVKLICGMISADAALFDAAAAAMVKAYGPLDVTSETMPFDFTHYYDREMGGPLYRRFVSFQRLVSPEILPRVKLATNDLEREFAVAVVPGGPVRPINLDPGYVETSKLVLASMKNFSHRMYLSGGVYGEVTLMYHKGFWEAFSWTFPDYASPRYRPFMDEARKRLKQQLDELHPDQRRPGTAAENEPC